MVAGDVLGAGQRVPLADIHADGGAVGERFKADIRRIIRLRGNQPEVSAPLLHQRDDIVAPRNYAFQPQFGIALLETGEDQFKADRLIRVGQR